MSTYADFVLLRALPSYGGAEVLRARRARDGQHVEAPVHLGLYSNDERVAQRIVAVAEASAQVSHEAVARIVEVGRYEGSLYAVAEAAEGVDLATILEHEKRRRGVPDPAFVVGVVFSLARIVQDLHDRSDVWARRGQGLTGLFPAGLRPDAVVLRKDGAVLLRVLAGAADDDEAPNAYRAPEVGTSRAGVAADVYALVQLLRALFAVDVSAHASPRVPTRAGVLPTLLVAALQQNPDDRPPLDASIDMLRDVFAENASNQSPAGVIRNALRREYRSLLFDDSARDEIARHALEDLRKRAHEVAASRVLLFPAVLQRAPAPELDAEVNQTISMKRHAPPSDRVDRVFTEEGDTSEGPRSPEPDSTDGAFASTRDVMRTPALPTPILDVAAASLAGEAEKTQKQARPGLLGSEEDVSEQDSAVPWVSVRDMSAIDVEPVGIEVDVAITPSPVATYAPPPRVESGVDMHDTIEMAARATAPRDVSFASNDPVPMPPDRKKP